LEVFVNCKFGYDINCEVVCEDGVIHMPAPSFPTIRKEGKLATNIETNWINRFIDSYDVELQDWIDHATRFQVGGPSAWDGYIAEVVADALVAAQVSGKMEKVELGQMPEFYKL
ncbi:MAG: inositol 2-dehydrogenase, partial [Bacillota bacterium]|nr:inositol 2-dehydrogenase [Bacillota bacterium]